MPRRCFPRAWFPLLVAACVVASTLHSPRPLAPAPRCGNNPAAARCEETVDAPGPDRGPLLYCEPEGNAGRVIEISARPLAVAGTRTVAGAFAAFPLHDRDRLMIISVSNAIDLKLRI